MGELNDRATQVLERIAEVWQIESDRICWTTSDGQDAPRRRSAPLQRR